MKTREGGLDLKPGRVPHGPCKGSEVCSCAVGGLKGVDTSLYFKAFLWVLGRN